MRGAWGRATCRRWAWGRGALFAALPAAGVSLLAAPVAVHAEPGGKPRVAMPYSCAKDRGRLRLEPSSAQVYEIADQRESRSFAACSGPQGARCQTWVVHRFTMQCGPDRVPWVEIVAAAMALRPGVLTELDDQRLVLSRRRARDLRFVRNCYERLSGASGRARIYDQALIDECWSLQRRAPGARIELPPGFAPATMIGARFLPPVRASIAAGASPAGGLAPGDGAADGASVSSPGGQLTAAMGAWRSHAAQPLPAAERPVAAVVTTIRPSGPQPAPDGAMWRWLPAIGLVVALGAAIWRLGWWKPASLRLSGAMAMLLPAASASEERLAAGLRSAARERLAATLETINRLPPVMPLRQVLARELHVAGQRLEALSTDEPRRASQWRRVRIRLQTVTRELERLAAIAEGAHSSIGSGGIPAVAGMVEPRDKVEAYALLGVNPDVNERILKKLVEALRQSWHPDQARDDDDRRRREDRIKQINVAWDLIQGKRVEA